MIDAAYEKAKRMYYRGKLTKKYRKYVSLQERCLAQMGMSGQRFSK
jgi:hypothetical protein